MAAPCLPSLASPHGRLHGITNVAAFLRHVVAYREVVRTPAPFVFVFDPLQPRRRPPYARPVGDVSAAIRRLYLG